MLLLLCVCRHAEKEASERAKLVVRRRVCACHLDRTSASTHNGCQAVNGYDAYCYYDYIYLLGDRDRLEATIGPSQRFHNILITV